MKLGPALLLLEIQSFKSFEHASAPMLEFGELIAMAGFPPGVVNIITGYGDPCGKELTSHPLVARVSFTGGPKSLKLIKNSANNFAEVSLELGGKSPFFISMMQVLKVQLMDLRILEHLVGVVLQAQDYIFMKKLQMNFCIR